MTQEQIDEFMLRLSDHFPHYLVPATIWVSFATKVRELLNEFRR